MLPAGTGLRNASFAGTTGTYGSSSVAFP